MPMSNLPLLSILIWTPIFGGLVLLFIKEYKDDVIKYVSYLFTTVTLIISLIGSLKSTAFRKNPFPNSKALLGNSNQRHPAGDNLNI